MYIRKDKKLKTKNKEEKKRTIHVGATEVSWENERAQEARCLNVRFKIKKSDEEKLATTEDDFFFINLK